MHKFLIQSGIAFPPLHLYNMAVRFFNLTIGFAVNYWLLGLDGTRYLINNTFLNLRTIILQLLELELQPLDSRFSMKYVQAYQVSSIV